MTDPTVPSPPPPGFDLFERDYLILGPDRRVAQDDLEPVWRAFEARQGSSSPPCEIGDFWEAVAALPGVAWTASGWSGVGLRRKEP